MEDKNNKNPWLGLESYKEGDILYGRDEDIQNLSQCVLNDVDTLLYGKSGIGKSSILNAGVIPAARRNGYLPISIRFSHKEKRYYLYQIKEAIANAMIPIPLDEDGNRIQLSREELEQREAELKQRIVEVVKCKNEDEESIYEFFNRHTFHDASGERIKLLIIFDQFEEIFTLQNDESSKKRFFGELADFLNDIMPTYLQEKVTSSIKPQRKITDIDADNLNSLFKELKLDTEENISEYVTDNDIHLVFTIREDFLSEFEFYTVSIPSLKQNRYGLRPINEEQAAQIILNPQPGLIDESVAKLIIEKVTGRKDFKLDGKPEIEVDSAVLSLYLKRLYDAKTLDTITLELVEDKCGEIIEDFYNDAISSISESTIKYLEDRLLNGQGRRDNITIFDAIHDGGATEEDIDTLCNRKKILRQFYYAGDLRIEYIHDILCPVVKAHKEERLRILIIKENQEKDRKTRLKYKIAICLLTSLLLCAFTYLLWNNENNKRECVLSLYEDETVSIDNYWKAEVTVLNERLDTIFPSIVIDKTNTTTTYPVKNIKKARIFISFLAGNFTKIDTLVDFSKSDIISVPISRAKGRKKYTGKVFSNFGSRQPLNDAIVIIGGQIEKTNFKGEYVAYVDKSDISNDGKIRIYKNGYPMVTEKLNNPGKYSLKPENRDAFDKGYSFINKKLTKNKIEMEGKIGGEYASHLTMCVEQDSIYGYFYYDKSMKKIIAENQKRKEKREKLIDEKEVYILFSGKLNKDKSFHLDCYDDAYNIQELIGFFSNNDRMEGYWHSYSMVRKKFYFDRIKTNNDNK